MYQVLSLSLLTLYVICNRDGGENIWKEWFLYTWTAKQKALLKDRFGSQTVSERIDFINCPSQNSEHKLSSLRSLFERNPSENIPILFGKRRFILACLVLIFLVPPWPYFRNFTIILPDTKYIIFEHHFMPLLTHPSSTFLF